MKFIKKVSSVPLAQTEGYIIDSFNTSDDHTTNAPSLNAVENIFRIRRYSQSVTISANGNLGVNMGSLDTPSGYTYIGCVAEKNGYGDQWVISYALYGSSIFAKVHSFYGASLTSEISCYAIYVKDDIYNTIKL